MARVKMLQPSIAVLGASMVERKPWHSDNEHRRLSGRALQQARLELFSREPLCRKCKANGRTSVATQRDHIIPLAEGGTEEDSNIQALCEPCHGEKTAEEAKRGAARARFGASPDDR